MEHYVGLDVSLKLTAICVVDRTGKIQREGVVHSDPEAIAAFIKSMRRMSCGSDSKQEQRRHGYGLS
jgi:predicted NBD/HSP70 family sugar kinase